MGPAGLLGLVWESAPSGIEPYPYGQLVVGCINHGSRRSKVDEIEGYAPDSAIEQLPSLTTIESIPAVLTIEQSRTRIGIDQWVSGGTEVVLGPVANRLAELGASKLDPRTVADATEHLVQSGDVSEVEALFPKALSSTPAHEPSQTPAEAPHHGHPRRETQPAHATNNPAAGNDPSIWVSASLFASPPLGRLSAYRGRFCSDIESVTACTRRGIPCTRRGNSGGRSRNWRRLERLDVATENELLGRTPLGTVPRIAVPTQLYREITEWRPVLEESEPLAALLQLILLSSKRDDHADPDGDCTGMPIANEIVFAAFGYRPQSAWDRGINAGMLLELYRKHIDSDFEFSGWDHESGRARVVLSNSIPQDIIDTAKEYMLSPEDEHDWKYLITGDAANSNSARSLVRKNRMEEIEENEPVVDAPKPARMMKEYLNGLDTVNVFSHGQHGVFSSGKLEEMVEVAKEIPDEERRDQELRKIYWIRRFPKPLYAACDRSPRLRADRYNQLMNVKSEIRKSLYVEGKDFELDLSKAHLASYIPTVRREGIETPQLDKYLRANLEDDEDLLAQGDLWMDLAHAADTEVFDDLEALRDAVKRLYSVVYGMERGRVLHEIAAEYDDETGFYPETHEPLEPLLSHPLVEELFDTRGKLRGIVEERGGLEDAEGRHIPLSKWNGEKNKEDRWRGVMAYVNASYETEIMAAPFREARAEKARDARTRFKIWLYQGDGFTMRVSSKASPQRQIDRLQDAVSGRAGELGVPTELEVDWPHE